MPPKNILVLSIFIQAAIIAATPRSYQSARLTVRAPSNSLTVSTDALNAGEANVNGTLTAEPKTHHAPAGSSTGALKTLNVSATDLRQSPKVTTNRILNETVHTSSTSSEESGGEESGAQNTPSKGSTTVVTDKVTHAVVNTSLSPDDHHAADSTTAAKEGDLATTLHGTGSTATATSTTPKTLDVAKAPPAGEAVTTPKTADSAKTLKTVEPGTPPETVDSAKTPKAGTIPKAGDSATMSTSKANVTITKANSTLEESHVADAAKPADAAKLAEAANPAGLSSHATKDSGTPVPKSIEVHDPKPASNVDGSQGHILEGSTAQNGTKDSSPHANAGPAVSSSTLKAIDVNVGKPNTQDDHSTVVKGVDVKTNPTGPSEDLNAKVVQVNISKPNNNQLGTNSQSDASHKSPDTSSSDTTKAQQAAIDPTKFIDISSKKLETKAITPTDAGHSDPEQDAHRPKNSDDSFPPNITSILKEPPSSNEKSNAQLLHPQSKLSLVTALMLAGLTAAVA